MSVLLFDGSNAKLQAMEETSWPEGSIKKHSIGPQTISDAGHSVEPRE